jgi:two-component system, LytTR family, sensor kinase
MHVFNKKISSDQLFRLLFHFLFWTIWLGWPFLNQQPDFEKQQRFLRMIVPVNLTSIPLFLINSEILFPYFFRKKKLSLYFLLLFILTVVFIQIQILIKIHFGFNRHFWDFISIFPPMFISAISLSYGLIITMNQDEKNKQEITKEKLQSELSFLRSQISPHFIFNVLNSIVYLTNTKPEIARKVTIQLSELIRYMLYESDDAKVPLDTEMKYLENYINLQKIRFEDDVQIDLKENIGSKSFFIEPMLLIPFVENAFKHGVGMSKNPSIEIVTEVKENQLFFSVKNTKNMDLATNKDANSGIGLRNVKRRLELLYPKNHQLTLKNEEEFYTIELNLKLN